MFSIMTIEASTIIPTPSMSPVNVIIFRVMPASFIAKRVISIERGIEIPIITVLFILRRNRNKMAIASMAPCNAELMRSLIVDLIVWVSSEIISKDISAGSIFFTSSIFLYTPSAAVMVLVPLCF